MNEPLRQRRAESDGAVLADEEAVEAAGPEIDVEAETDGDTGRAVAGQVTRAVEFERLGGIPAISRVLQVVLAEVDEYALRLGLWRQRDAENRNRRQDDPIEA